MPALTIRNIPEASFARLKSRAARGHRSLNGEILAIFEEAFGGAPAEGPVWMPPVPLPPKPTFASFRPEAANASRRSSGRSKWSTATKTPSSRSAA